MVEFCIDPYLKAHFAPFLRKVSTSMASIDVKSIRHTRAKLKQIVKLLFKDRALFCRTNSSRASLQSDLRDKALGTNLLSLVMPKGALSLCSCHVEPLYIALAERYPFTFSVFSYSTIPCSSSKRKQLATLTRFVKRWQAGLLHRLSMDLQRLVWTWRSQYWSLYWNGSGLSVCFVSGTLTLTPFTLHFCEGRGWPTICHPPIFGKENKLARDAFLQ